MRENEAAMKVVLRVFISYGVYYNILYCVDEIICNNHRYRDCRHAEYAYKNVFSSIG